MNLALTLALAYMVGAIPFAYISGHIFRGVDIRTVGDGNSGASNVLRNIGLLPGVFVVAGDIGKGAVAIVAARALGGASLLPLAAGAMTVAGHNWPLWLRCRGGRGAGPAIGVLLALVPLEMSICIVLAAPAFLATRDMRWCGFAMFVPLPLLCWGLGQPLAVVAYALGLACLVGLTHLITTRRLPVEARNEASMVWVGNRATLPAP